MTMLWFLACMNVWNLIDGMDGLASGVGLLVSGTLMLVAIQHGNPGVAFLAAALAGSLAGFLLYNWHPACIFLGDSGSLLIGLLIGVIGVQGSLKEGSAISILFPILAMGLPISDTAMAIFRRWVRNLPLLGRPPARPPPPDRPGAEPAAGGGPALLLLGVPLRRGPAGGRVQERVPGAGPGALRAAWRSC